MKIQLKPTLKQYQAWKLLRDETTKDLFFGGGAGGGKSWLGCEHLLAHCYEHPGIKLFLGRKELTRLMKSVYVTWMKVCAYHNVPKDDWRLNGQYNYIEFKNGSRIDLLDLAYSPQDPLYERFGSLEYTQGWIEEGSEVSFKAYDVLKSRVGRHRNDEFGVKPLIMVTCNPHKGWIYNEAYRPWKKGELPRRTKFIQSLYKDNPHHSKDYEEQLVNIRDDAQRQRLMYGNWEFDDDPARLVEYEAICEVFDTRLNEDNTKKYLTIDVARQGKDKSVVRMWQGWQVKKVWAWDKNTILPTDSNKPALTREVKKICNEEKIPRTQVIADEDGVGGGFVDAFRCHGFINNSRPVQPEESEKDKNKLLNYANLKTQCAYIVASKITNRLIGEDQNEYKEETMQELEQLKRAKINDESRVRLMSKDEMKENIGRSPDHLDTYIMRAWFELNPQEGGENDEKEHSRAMDDFLQECQLEDDE